MTFQISPLHLADQTDAVAPPEPAAPDLVSLRGRSLALSRLLAVVPDRLQPARAPYPLLTALAAHDRSSGSDLARQLMIIAAATHAVADERRTAEYILRNRGSVRDGRRTACGLLIAARTAVEMDLRRRQSREVPTEADAPCFAENEFCLAQTADHPPVSEMVLDKLEDVTGAPITGTLREALLNSVSVALDLAERYRLNGGNGASFRRLRSKARPDQRLVTHLTQMLDNPCAAAWLARLLIGPDQAPLEAALLWWCTRCGLEATDVPDRLRSRWIRNLGFAEKALA